MNMPYNAVPRQWFNRRLLNKIGLLPVCLAATISGISCRKAATASYDATVVRPAAEAIASADQLYAERADLGKVRQGIVTLRQAQADNTGNYDIAWRLAKFSYYLGAHSPNSTEQDKAFQEGINAGKLAVQIQSNKPEGHFWLGANYGGSAQISTLTSWAEINDIKD